MKTYSVLALAGLICTTFYLAGCSEPAPPAVPPEPVAAAAPKPAPHTPTVTAYNGLLYAEMGALSAALERRGDKVTTLWHDAQPGDDNCPEYIIGHSLGGNAAIRQAIKCQARKHPPIAIIVIDAGRAPVTYTVPANAKYTCESFYNPDHPIGGQEIAGKCKNTVVSGYDHLLMPSAPGIVKAILNTVPAATK